MDKLADYLIEKETITGKEFMEIFRREKGLPDPKEETKEEGQSGKAAESHHKVDVTITDDTTHSQETGQTVQVPEITLPKAPVIPGAESEQREGAKETSVPQSADGQQPPETGESSEAGKPSDTERTWPPQQPPTGSSGRFSGGNL